MLWHAIAPWTQSLPEVYPLGEPCSIPGVCVRTRVPVSVLTCDRACVREEEGEGGSGGWGKHHKRHTFHNQRFSTGLSGWWQKQSLGTDWPAKKRLEKSSCPVFQKRLPCARHTSSSWPTAIVVFDCGWSLLLCHGTAEKSGGGHLGTINPIY